MQAFTELSAKYSGTQEGAIADMYLASYAVDQGNQDEAEKRYKRVVDDGPKAYASLARIALSQIYISEGKTAEAEKVLRDAIANPSATVSKEQAQLGVGRDALQIQSHRSAQVARSPAHIRSRNDQPHGDRGFREDCRSGVSGPAAGQVRTGAAWIMTGTA